jgi:hypothetical protein
MRIWRIGKLLAIYIFPFSLMFLLVIGSLFIDGKGPLSMTDFETPLNFKNYLKKFIYPLSPFNLGDFSHMFNYDLFYILIAFFSNENIFVSQFILFYISRLFAYLGMLLFLRGILKESIFISIIASLFYTFSPSFIAWFSLPYQIFAGLTPLLFYFIFKFIIQINNQDEKCRSPQSNRTILWNGFKIAVVGSFIVTGYFQGIVPLLILILIALPFIFLFNGFSRETLLNIGLGAIFVFLSTLYLCCQFVRIAFVTLQMAQTFELQVYDPIYYKKAALFNLFRLGGGSPWNLSYNSINKSPATVIWPILAFVSFLFIRKNQFIRKKEHHYWLLLIQFWAASCILVLIGLAEAFKHFITNEALWKNLGMLAYILSGLRSPDRIIETLTFLYTIAISITLTYGFEWIIEKFSTPSNLRMRFYKKCLLLLLRGIFLISVIIVPYFFSFGIPGTFSKETYAQLAIPMPSAYENLRKVLTQFSEDSKYRYVIYPFYSPLGSFLRLNYPNFMYASSFSDPNVYNFVRAINKLIENKDFAFKYGLDLAHVRYILILPDSISEEELQAWRLQGDVRLSSTDVHLFGSPMSYTKLFSNTNFYFTEVGNTSGIRIFKNENAPDLFYIPSRIIILPKNSFENINNISQALKFIRIINTLFNIGTYATISEKEWKEIYPFEEGNLQFDDSEWRFGIFNTNNGSISYGIIKNISLKEKIRVLPSFMYNVSPTFIVWKPKNATAVYEDNNPTIYIGEKTTNLINIWIHIPPPNIMDFITIEENITLYNMTVKDIKVDFLAQDGTVLGHPLDLKIIKEGSYTRIYVRHIASIKDFAPAFMRVILYPESITGVSPCLTLSPIHITQGNMVYLLMNDVNENNTVYYKNCIIRYSSKEVETYNLIAEKSFLIIENPELIINDVKSANEFLFLGVKMVQNNQGYGVNITYTVSDIDIYRGMVDGTLIIQFKDGVPLNRTFYIPIAFGIVYNNDLDFHIFVDTNDDQLKAEFSHFRANFYSNGYMIKISPQQHFNSQYLKLKFKITYNETKALLKTAWSLSVVAIYLGMASILIVNSSLNLLKRK